MKTQIATVFFLASLCAGPAPAADEREVFFGLPTIKYEVSVDDSQRTKLGSADSTKNAVTRENRKLVYFYSDYGDFHYFIDPRGGGYVKIARTPGGKVTFLEHVGLGMITITYFGSAQSFTP